MQLSIAGRYLVYVPQGEGIGVSRRLDDKERERLRKQAKGLEIGEGGVIIRTAAQGAKRADFQHEMKYLHKLHEVLQKRSQEASAPDDGLPGGRPVDPRGPGHLLPAVRARDRGRPPAAPPPGVVLHPHRPRAARRGWSSTRTPSSPLFERFGVEKEIQSTLRRRVDLPSGGYLIIDYAEAMTVIDINSGSFIGRGKGARLEDTITKTNLEAADEVVRQLRLRDIGGIIVIDFIDMARARNRDAVLKTLRKALDEDRTKTYVVEISPLGLVEMTRQNVTEGVREIITKTCPTCEGEGVVLSEETVAIDAERRLRELAAERPATEAFLIQVHPRVAALLAGGPGRPLLEIEEETGKHFHFEGSEALPIDHFRVSHGGLARRRGGARAAVPVRRRGARLDRGAAHVRRGRRRGQARRLRDLGGPGRASWWARRRSCGSRTWAARRPRPRWWRARRSPTPRRAATARRSATSHVASRRRTAGGGTRRAQAAPARAPRRPRAPQGRLGQGSDS